MCITKLTDRIDISHNPFIRDARLVRIDGNGSLRVSTSIKKQRNDDMNRFVTQISLNDVPLIQMNRPECPTCMGLLATGLGIETAECEEIEKVRNRINSQFVSLDKSIDDISPILSLLESGKYIVADAVCYPTDGNGNFFWNVPDDFSASEAMNLFMNQDELYGEDIGYPAYLYPTQDTNCYDRERIDHYISIFQSAKSNPRAIVYNFADAISFVIDGHHKICAAALLQQMVYCIIIIPYEVSRNSSAVFNGSGHQKMRVSHGEINHRKWEEEYQETTNCYPNINKFIEYMKYLDCFAEMVVDEKIRLLQYDDSDAGQIKKSAILTAMQISDDARLKETALLFLNSSVETNTLVTIYRVLAGIKDDPRSSVFLWSILLNILTRMTQL